MHSYFSSPSADELIIVFFLVLAVHYTPSPLNSLFGTARWLDGNVSLQFQGQASLFSERNSPARDTLIHAGDQCTMRSILTTASLEDFDRRIYRKPSFMFGDAAPDNDHQLLTGEGQWIFKLDGEKYYLPSSKQATFSLVLLSMRDEGSKDAVASNSDY